MDTLAFFSMFLSSFRLFRWTHSSLVLGEKSSANSSHILVLNE